MWPKQDRCFDQQHSFNRFDQSEYNANKQILTRLPILVISAFVQGTHGVPLVTNIFRDCNTVVMQQQNLQDLHIRSVDVTWSLLILCVFWIQTVFFPLVCPSVRPPPISVTSQKLKRTFVCAAWGSFFSLLVKSWTCPSACQVLLLGSLSYFTLVCRIHWSYASFCPCAHLSALSLVHLLFVESQWQLID